AGQVGGYCEPQLVSERDQVMGRDRRQFGEVRHAQTLRLLPSGEPCKYLGGRRATFTSRSSSINAPSRPRAGKTGRRPGGACTPSQGQRIDPADARQADCGMVSAPVTASTGSRQGGIWVPGQEAIRRAVVNEGVISQPLHGPASGP